MHLKNKLHSSTKIIYLIKHLEIKITVTLFLKYIVQGLSLFYSRKNLFSFKHFPKKDRREKKSLNFFSFQFRYPILLLITTDARTSIHQRVVLHLHKIFFQYGIDGLVLQTRWTGIKVVDIQSTMSGWKIITRRWWNICRLSENDVEFEIDTLLSSSRLFYTAPIISGSFNLSPFPLEK